MLPSPLLQHLAARCTLSAAFIEALEKEAIQLSLPTHHRLLEAPNVASQTYFILSGLACGFYYRDESRQLAELWSANDFLLIPKSFCCRTPAIEFIEVACHTQVVCLSHESYVRLNGFPETEALARTLLTGCYEKARQRTTDLLHLSATQRYQQTIKKYRGIEQYISQQHLASYLGISPQSLSRLKRNLRS